MCFIAYKDRFLPSYGILQSKFYFGWEKNVDHKHFYFSSVGPCMKKRLFLLSPRSVGASCIQIVKSTLRKAHLNLIYRDGQLYVEA